MELPDEVTAGGILTYTLTVTNLGPSSTHHIVVQDDLPAGIIVLKVTPSQGICLKSAPGDPAKPYTCYMGSLGSSLSAIITIVVRVPSSTPAGTLFYNQAFLTSNVYDPNNANDYATNETLVNAWADLLVTKTQVPFVPDNDDIAYTITIRNTGPSDALGVQVTDYVPGPFDDNDHIWTCVASGGATCNPTGFGNVVETVNLPAGSQVIFYAFGAIAKYGSITMNYVTAATPLGVPDPYVWDNWAMTVYPYALWIPHITQ